MTDPRQYAFDLMKGVGMPPDPWQVNVLQSQHERLLLNCCRQAGKSTVVAARALAEAVIIPGTLVLLVSRSFRQVRELYRKVVEFHDRIGAPLRHRRSADELTLANSSRVVCLPCRGETIRGFSNVALVLLDEAAMIPDDIYRAVSPMLAVSGGRLIALSTPFGKRGFFWDGWVHGGDDWARIEVPGSEIPRIPPAFLAAERRRLGEAAFRREFCCSFESLEGLVFPNFARCVVPGPAPADGRRYGGIDFGFRNPFAALWGILDREGTLWLTGEHYDRQRPLSYHATKLPRGITWYADPAGAGEIAELRAGNRTVIGADNAIRPGLARISARLEAGKLKIVDGACPNLLAEAGLYRYGDRAGEREAEVPVDEYNHAISALRYLLSRLDSHGMRGCPKPQAADSAPAEPRPYPQELLDHYRRVNAWTGQKVYDLDNLPPLPPLPPPKPRNPNRDFYDRNPRAPWDDRPRWF